jgi:hypothetical protein
MLSNADMLSSLREHNGRALNQLLLERFGGKVGRASPSNCRAGETLDRSEMSRRPGPRGPQWDRGIFGRNEA